jgi:large subunit ribosomal protein L18
MKTNEKVLARTKRHRRVRKKVVGTPERPRLAVFRSNRHIYAQVIDDVAGRTLAASSSLATKAGDDPIANAKEVGLALAARAKEAGVTSVAFDRGGFMYHGRVKALADGAREGGLEF